MLSFPLKVGWITISQVSSAYILPADLLSDLLDHSVNYWETFLYVLALKYGKFISFSIYECLNQSFLRGLLIFEWL